MATLNDYLKECENFQYSKENFDLVKEAAEINIAAMYLESQQYMVENAGAFEGLDSEYMMESADESSVKLLAQKASGKKEKWAAKAQGIWKRIVAAFKTFWNAIVERWNKLRGKAADIKANLARVKITPEVAKEIGELVDRAVKESGIPISDKQKESFKNLPKNVWTTCEDGVKNKLAAAICNRTIDLTLVNGGQFALAFSENQLKDLFKLVSDKKVLAANADGLATLKGFIESTQKKNLTKGMSVSKDKTELEELNKYINDAELKVSQDITSLKDSVKNDPGNKEGVGDVSTLFNNVQLVSHNSMRLYSAIIRFHVTVTKGLETIIKKAPKGDAPAEGDDKKDKDEE